MVNYPRYQMHCHVIQHANDVLKGLAEAKIMIKSVILFRVLNMTEIPVFPIFDMVVNN